MSTCLPVVVSFFQVDCVSLGTQVVLRIFWSYIALFLSSKLSIKLHFFNYL